MADVIKLAPPPAGDDGFHRIYDGLADQIDAFRCVQATLRARADLDAELLAALGLLTRTTARVDELHTELEEWSLRRKQRPTAPQP